MDARDLIRMARRELMRDDPSLILPITPEQSAAIVKAMRGMFSAEARAKADAAMERAREDLRFHAGECWLFDPHVKHASVLKFDEQLTDDDKYFLRVQGIEP